MPPAVPTRVSTRWGKSVVSERNRDFLRRSFSAPLNAILPPRFASSQPKKPDRISALAGRLSQKFIVTACIAAKWCRLLMALRPALSVPAGRRQNARRRCPICRQSRFRFLCGFDRLRRRRQRALYGPRYLSTELLRSADNEELVFTVRGRSFLALHGSQNGGNSSRRRPWTPRAGRHRSLVRTERSLEVRTDRPARRPLHGFRATRRVLPHRRSTQVLIGAPRNYFFAA